MNRLYTTLLLISACLACLSSHAQGTHSSEVNFTGKWVNGDTGIIITPAYMDKLNLSGQSWEYSYFAHQQFHFITSELRSHDQVLEGWIVAVYTSHRDYHTDGTESSTETAEYRALRLERLGRDSLRLSLSAPFAIHLQNKIPEIMLPIEFKKAFEEKKIYTSILTLKRLAE